jgi:hypothetical protein
MKEEIKWSPVFPLFNSKKHLDAGGKPGVYRIRAFAGSGEALSISRLGGVDPEGILHIGKSKNLGRRIRTFRQAAEGLQAAHHAGCEFYDWDFEKIIPRGRLRYDYAIASTEKDALNLERSLHEEYRKKYFDRPPLDGTSGQTGG